NPTATLAQLVNELRRELRTRRAERVTERDRATIHIDFLFRNLELAHHGNHLCRERLVELHEVDVFHLHSRAFERLRYGLDRTHAHDVRLDAGRRERDETRERLETKFLCAI